MLKNDYIEQQIEALCKTFAALLFGRSRVKEILSNQIAIKKGYEANDKLTELLINKLVNQGNFVEAEHLMIEMIKAEKTAERLKFALEFYNKLNEFSEEELHSHNFSKQKIEEGVDRLQGLYSNFEMDE